VDIAGLLGGRVQGDGGELYSIERGQVVRDDTSGAPGESSSPSGAAPFHGVEPTIARDGHDGLAVEELEAALGALSTRNAAMFEDGSGDGGHDDPNASFACPPDEALEREQGAPPKPIPFKVGQRVRTPWGRPGTVVAIDPDADSGMGHIEIRYADGRTATTSCVGHGLHAM
jgi:hypothetical protein